MSHFTVLVIGNNPEDQLAPYDENERVPKYRKDEVSQEDKETFIKHYVLSKGFEYKNNFAELYAKHGKDWNGGEWKEHTDGKWYEYSTYNPKSKWDWYQLGGRWTGYLKVKNGVKVIVGKAGLHTDPAKEGWADAAKKSEIDFEYMKKKAAAAAGKTYDKAMKIIGHLPMNKTWEQMLAEHGVEHGNRDHRDKIDTVRDLYWAQERCEAWKKVESTMKDFGFSSSPDDFTQSREDYMLDAALNSYITYAVVKDGEWYERGAMGWFGMASNEKDQHQWRNEFNKLIEGLPEDTILSVYDCHI